MAKKVLFVGEHPYGVTGNSHMMKAVLERVDQDRFDTACFSETFLPIYSNPFSEYSRAVITPDDMGDQYGCGKLIRIIENTNFDILVMVGVDLWHYHVIFDRIMNCKRSRNFKWAAIFPYDLNHIRQDWLKWINALDYAGVYSLYGYNLLRPYVPNVHYFRPPLLAWDIYKPYSKEERKLFRNKHFSGHDRDRFVFGFVGVNQVRKDPQRVIRAFFEVKKENPEVCFYFHTNLAGGIFNLGQYIEDCGAVQGDILIKNQGLVYTDEQMVEVYNAIDCLVNTSLQEGLSWTILQAMLCETRVIAANNTAQIELLEGGCGVPVTCNELSYIPLITANGPSYVETRACNEHQLIGCMREVSKGWYGEKYLENARNKALDWVMNPSDINELLESVVTTSFSSSSLVDKILFMQHSSAGDVLMTTRCFKGLKERHNGLPLVYMTQKQYHDIVTGNPYIEEILDWDETESRKYQFVYNIHGSKILPGHWGRNCNSILSDFYWKLLNVEPDDFFIDLKKPEGIDLPTQRPILLVHTTGGSAHFRTYKYMADVCEHFRDKYLTVQVGGEDDFPAGADIDLRGQLSFRETAWVTSHAKLAVTVDSFMSHLCGALGVSQVCLFGSGNYVVVKPNQVKGQLICMSPDYLKHCKGLGPCSGVISDCPTPCTSRHDPKEIIKKLDILERSIDIDLLMKRMNTISLGEK
jgi:ADP-heptose:LPS heptosyltransferase/glycosyltransferase involved in cell wall biosynthesis